MEQSGRRRGQQPPRNEGDPPRWPAGDQRRQQPPGNGRRPPQDEPADGSQDTFENGWFGKPTDSGSTRASRPSANGHVNGQQNGRVNGKPTGRTPGEAPGRVNGSRNGMPPVAPPRAGVPGQADQGSRPAMPPVTRSGMPPVARGGRPPGAPPFDQDAFDESLTDPGPFGRMAFETHPPMRPAGGTPATEKIDTDDVDPPDDDLFTDEDRASKPPPKTRRKLPFWIELPILVVVALLLTFVIQTFVARVYVIPSGSMELTLHGNNGSGDRILVDKVVYDFHGPRPGDVVVFKGPAGWDQTEFFVNTSSNPVTHWLHQIASSIGIAKPDEYDLVKRVVAVGGQTVACCDAQHRIEVNGKPLDEPYVYWQPDRGGPAQQLQFGPIKVPNGDLWVMGDNRNNSDDSRYQNGGGIHGVVPVGNVIGKARTIIWPPSRWRGIGDHNPQALAVAAPAPSWFNSVPATGVGVLISLPTLWFGRRFGAQLRAAAGIPARRRRRSAPPEQGL
ncbi:MAG TPA: signal peptidase I [Pseudonocardiaceae bacterium]|jgi:signal peptidase I